MVFFGYLLRSTGNDIFSRDGTVWNRSKKWVMQIEERQSVLC